MLKINILLLIVILIGCKSEINNLAHSDFIVEAPTTTPIPFKEDLIPEGKLIHKGVFSPDMQEYLYTISDKDFNNFIIYSIKNEEGAWSKPKEAFFNSDYNDHGMSFSPDGQSIFFSSTRPVNIDGVVDTWHLWKVSKVDGVWQQPLYIDIPNLRDKLVSHPSVTSSGTLFFHSSNLDYSEMHLYQSQLQGEIYVDATKVQLPVNLEKGTCTPYISPKEDYLMFASIGVSLELMITHKDATGNWGVPKKLNAIINNLGQGNPYVTPDNKYLFYTSGSHENAQWLVNWVNIESEIKNN